MCTLVAIYEFHPGRNPYWVWFNCGTALRCSDGTLRFKVGSSLPCPTHNPDEWNGSGINVDQIGVVADIAQDPLVRSIM